MNRKTRLSALLISLTLVAAAPALASEIYVIHGIPGQDLGLDPALPVDVCLAGGTPVLPGVTFGAIAGPLTLDPGRYDIEVRLAAGTPCTGGLATLTTLLLSVAESSTVVAHLTEEGTPALTKFVNDVRPAAQGSARVVARHGAGVGPVSVTLSKGGKQAVIPFLDNSDQFATEVMAGSWAVRIFPFGSRKPVFGPAIVNLEANTVSYAYAVGSLAKGSFAVVLQTLPLP